MKLAIIAAVSDNGIIGCNGKLPWKISSDLKQFKKITSNHVVIMGRKTWESIGRPLPNRFSIVMTNQAWLDGVDIVDNLDDALEYADHITHYANSCGNLNKEIAFVIGGEKIYELAIEKANLLYLTRVHANVDGDACFPEIDFSQWNIISQERHIADEKNEYDFTFEVYQKCLI